MKCIIFLILFSNMLTFQFLPAQAPDTLWTRTYGGSGNDAGNAIQKTSDGGYIIVGYTESFGAGGRDVWLIKTDAFGDTLWTKTFGGSDWDEGNSVQQTTDGGYIITGYISTFSPGIRDVWLIKTDPAGDTLWTKSFGGVESDWGNFVQQTSDGGYVVVGATRSFSVGLSDVWLIKTNSSGDTLWTKTYGGLFDDWGYSVQQTSDTGYVFVVTTSSFGESAYDVWLIKTDANGDTLWTRIFWGSGFESCQSVQQASDGGFMLAVTTSSFGAGLRDLWMIKTDDSGNTLWTKTYGYYLSEYIYDVQQTADDGYVFVGGTCSFSSGAIWDLWLIKTDATGYPHWTRTLGGNSADEGHCLQQTSDGGYIISGYTSSFGAGGDDVWLIKLAPDPSNLSNNNDEKIPIDFALRQNYPNPFNPTTTIEFDLPMTSEVSLKVFNILGEEVSTLVSDRLSSGSYSYEWDAGNLASGVYLYRLHAGDFVETRKMVLME